MSTVYESHSPKIMFGAKFQYHNQLKICFFKSLLDVYFPTMRKKAILVPNVKKACNTRLSLPCIHNQDIIIKVSDCVDHKHSTKI